MAIVGFSFTKINVERKKAVSGKLGIKNNVAIKSVEKSDLSFGSTKQAAVKFNFEFSAIYEPDVGQIVLVGEVLDVEDEKKTKEILDEWKKDKKVPQDVMNNILNTVLSKCNVEALILSRDINLPSPIPLPKVSTKGIKG